MNTTNQTPAASASRHTPEPWAPHPMMPSAVYSGQLVHVATCYNVPDSNASRIVACVNALAGMEPGAVAGLVAAVAEAVQAASLETYNTVDMEPLRASLAALKGGAK